LSSFAQPESAPTTSDIFVFCVKSYIIRNGGVELNALRIVQSK
jgi:hypothetical protein